jgi:putative chitinase
MTVPITAQQIRAASKGAGKTENLNSVLVSLEKYGADFGLDQPHRLVHYLAQLMHESGYFHFDAEVWGPTPAQARYDTRTDLGNTPEKDGDGYLYRGRGPIQLTGKANYAAFGDWCHNRGYHPPDFVAKPDLINSDPWEGLVAIWYWSSRNLNRWADQNDIETITKKINGGKNGLADRIDCFGRLALVMCGYGVDAANVRRYQQAKGLAVDGDVGPKTRAALFKDLVAMSSAADRAVVRAAPVVELATLEKPVVPASVDKEVRQKTNWLS